MKREYIKPSMAVNSFESSDVTSINTFSAVALNHDAGTAKKYGMTVFSASELKR